ncbi:IDE, partial [Symbiodinium sp. CCMP2456]
GPGSLQSLLKRKGWANKTIAGVVFDQDDFSIFKVGFDVSEALCQLVGIVTGLRQKEALYGAVFSVLRQMQESGMDAVPDYSIQETRELAELRWRFAEKPRSQQATLEAVEAMEDRLSPATYLSNRVLLFDPPEDGPNKGSLKRAIFGLLQQLTPERARYATFARENAGKAKQTETWYGVKYAERELQKSAFTGWSTRPTADLLEGWSYPKPNPFIPKDFDLAWPQASAREKAAASSKPPELIRKDDRWRVFFKADQAFGVPKATVILQFWFPDAEHRSSSAPGSAVDTPEGRIVARIWQLSLADRLTEEYYDAQLAGLNAGCGSTTVGLNVSFSGYSDKLPVFVGEVLAKIRDFDGPSESEFARALDNLKREQASFDVQQPFAHAAYFSRLATFCPEYSIEDLRKATSKVTLSAVRDYSRLLRSAEQGFFGQKTKTSLSVNFISSVTMRPSTRQNLALAFIFMLAVRDVSAARDSFNVAEMVTLAANTMEQSSQFQVRGMDTKYRIMPDAIVMTKEMKTMAVVGISGWQAFDGRSWGPSKYSKDEMLWIRTERNPIIGETTASTIPWRYAGYPVYRKGSQKPYYLYKGVQSTIDIDAVNMASEETFSEVHVEVEGQTSKPLKSPDTELVAMVDAMLGQSSCLNSPSLCAFRCFYDSDDDVCGPLAFCKKVAEGETPTALAPFGDQQKCKAVGGSTHEEADNILTTEAIPALKEKALDVVKKMEDLEAVSASSAGRSSMKKTAELWEEAADVLQVFETLPSRTDPEVGKFTAAHRRASQTDMKHWRHRQDRLTTAQYKAAKDSSVAALRASQDVSVPAKLHSELVNFVLKRPRIIIETAKLESKDKCVLKDETLAEKEQLKDFMNYFMKVPGYNAGDLEGQTLNLPEHCQDYLKTLSGSSMADLLSTADEAAAHMETATNPPDSRTASSLELKSERLLAAVSRDEEARILLHSDSWMDESEAARTQFVFILFCILVAIVCFVVAGLLFTFAIASMNSCSEGSGGGGCQAFFVCGILGGLVLFGAFCMAWPVGLAVVIGLIVAGIVAVVRNSMLEKPNMKEAASCSCAAPLGELSACPTALIHGNLRAKAAQDILSALDLLPFRGASAPTSSTSMLLRSRFACLDAGQECLQVQPEPNAENVNHALVSVFWTGDEAIDGLRTQLLERILKSAFYTSLRTQQQLGYIVQSQSDRIGNLARLVLVVQSSVKAPPDLLAAVDGFLKDFRPQLEALSDSRLASNQSGSSPEIHELLGFPISKVSYSLSRLPSARSSFAQTNAWELRRAGGSARLQDFNTPGAAEKKRAMSEMKEAARAKKILVIEDPLRFNQEAAKWPLRHDWLILALPEDPRKLRVKVALRNSGILKKKAPIRGLLLVTAKKKSDKSAMLVGIVFTVKLLQDTDLAGCRAKLILNGARHQTVCVLGILLQENCDFKKPYLLTYLHELALMAAAVPLAAYGQGRRLWAASRPLLFRGWGMGLLAFGANISFTAALVLTTASSAMTLEQLTPVFIAGLSFFCLRERYRPCQLFWLVVAIAGSVVTARSDLKECHSGACDGSQPLLGDLLVVVTCITAALYMVLFKLIFAHGCDWQTFFTYFMVKGMAVAVFGGLGLLFLPSSQLGLPTGAKGWYYLSINMILNICFNLSLAWGMLVVSPLACRLFVLLGLPLSLLLDSALGIAIVFQRVLGVFLVTLGVAGFEAATNANAKSERGERSGERGDLEIENVSDARDEAEAECITSPGLQIADTEVSDDTTSQSQEPSSWGSETLLLRPGHLIRRLQPSEDPLRAFEHAQRAADGAAWLPDPEEMAPHIPRGLLLLARSQRLEDSAVPMPTLLAVEEVCRRCPWMLKAEDGDSDEEKVVLDDRLLPAREPRRIEVCLRKVDPEDLLGFSVEADAIRPGCLQIVSISEKGLLGRRNAAVDAAERAVEGSWVVEVNGVVDNLEAMRCELEAATISLVVLVPQLEESDDFGRKRPSRPAVIPHAKVQGEVPLCRCNGYCKCGLADALGRAREDYGKWNVAQPALRISNLHPAVTEEMLYSLFTELAPVATLRVVRDTKTLESELHGFVNFHTFNDAQKVLEALDGRPLHGRRCFLSWSSRARREEAEAWAPPPLSTTEGSRQIRSYQLPVAPGKVEREGHGNTD